MNWHFRHVALVALLCVLAARGVSASEAGLHVPADVLARLDNGEAVELLVEYEAQAIEIGAAARRGAGARFDDDGVLAYRAEQYRLLKRRVDEALRSPNREEVADYSHLPLTLQRFRAAAALSVYVRHPDVKAVYADGRLQRVLAQSLPLSAQPAVAAGGLQGNGATVAVIDDGIDYTRAEFGNCTAPGVPASCRVPVALDFGTGSSSNAHGTNVAAVALGVAPGSRVAMLNAFSGSSAKFSDVISAINWAIANRSAYNIVAINMSLGDGVRYTAPCSTGNTFSTPVSNARSAGITAVAAAGNEAYTNGLAKPACTPGVVSVGAVYDANVGGLIWGGGLCTDSTTAADKVACFSNSASFLSLLAPGAMVTAGGSTMGGTSQASPHVAGAVAVLRAQFPAEALDATLARLTDSGVPVLDARNGLSKPRLNLLAAARPLNDSFAARLALAGNSGSAAGGNQLATTEAGEPLHAERAGGRSVWWRWTAPAAGQVSLDSHGSSFDTLLAVYQGGAVGALTAVAASDNDGGSGGASGLLFQAQAGGEYQIAVDGGAGATGALTLNWSLNPAAQANLSTSVAGPGEGAPGGQGSYTVTVSNAGPQSATGVSVVITLPAGASLIGGPPECVAGGSTVTCSVGLLPNGTATAIVLEVGWNTLSGPVSLAASVSSEVPDPTAANNVTTLPVTVLAATEGDVPTLPEWGALLLGALLLGIGVRRTPC